MRRRLPGVTGFALILATFVMLGCSSGHVKRGSLLYADGRYIEAAEVFERTEYRLPEGTPREKAEYGLYRGMTLLVLGDIKSAHRWLSYAYEMERSMPGSLREDRRALLDRGWFELGQRQRSVPAVPQGPGSALASSAAPAAQAPPLPPAEASPDAAPSQRTLVPR